jgi:hypothetical protein
MKMLGVSHTPCSSCGLQDVMDGIIFFMKKRHYTSVGLYNSFYLWLYSPIQALAASMKLSVSLQLLDLGQSVGLLGRVISLSQGLNMYTNAKHPCPEWDSNPRSRVRASEDCSCLRPLGYRDRRFI